MNVIKRKKYFFDREIIYHCSIYYEYPWYSVPALYVFSFSYFIFYLKRLGTICRLFFVSVLISISIYIYTVYIYTHTHTHIQGSSLFPKRAIFHTCQSKIHILPSAVFIMWEAAFRQTFSFCLSIISYSTWSLLCWCVILMTLWRRWNFITAFFSRLWGSA